MSGEGRTTGPLYEELHATRAASSPAVLLESGTQEDGTINYEMTR